jgi:hypothetical protein
VNPSEVYELHPDRIPDRTVEIGHVNADEYIKTAAAKFARAA